MAQQNPPMNAVTNITSTRVAKTVINHESENGSDVAKITFLRPNCMAMPPKSPPNRAPSNDKLAIQDACCGETVNDEVLCG